MSRNLNLFTLNLLTLSKKRKNFQENVEQITVEFFLTKII